MAWSWTPDRRIDPELMDAPGLPETEVADAYRVLRKVNRQLGNLAVLRHEARRFLREDQPGPGPISALDVGSGSGDIPRALADLPIPGGTIAAMALDRDPTAVAAARLRGVPVVRGDALRLPFTDASVDLVTAVKFAHHFHGSELALLIAEMARVARHRVVVLDIRRHRLAYWGFIAWSRVFTRNRLVRYDGPLSVLRGFTADEMRAVVAPLDAFRWDVRPYLGFQLALVGRRKAPSANVR